MLYELNRKSELSALIDSKTETIRKLNVELSKLKDNMRSIENMEKKSAELSKEINEVFGEKGYEDIKRRFIEIINAQYGEDKTLDFSAEKKPFIIDREFFDDENNIALTIRSVGYDAINNMYNIKRVSDRRSKNIAKRFYEKMCKKDVRKFVREFNDGQK